MGSNIEGNRIGLAQAIEQVRKELLVAQEAGAETDLRFRIGEVTLEFQVEFSKAGSAEAGVQLWVATIGASGSVSSTNSHTVTVVMTPQSIGPNGTLRDTVVNDQPSGKPPVPRAATSTKNTHR